MKKITTLKLTFVMLLVSAGAALAQPIEPTTVNVTWRRSPSSGVTGYKVYWTSAGGRTRIKTMGIRFATTLAVLPGVRYTAHATAFDATGLESEPSNEIQFTHP